MREQLSNKTSQYLSLSNTLIVESIKTVSLSEISVLNCYVENKALIETLK